jgi:hypothetical protein
VPALFYESEPDIAALDAGAITASFDPDPPRG